jgi:hypothetical protein
MYQICVSVCGVSAWLRKIVITLEPVVQRDAIYVNGVASGGLRTTLIYLNSPLVGANSVLLHGAPTICVTRIAGPGAVLLPCWVDVQAAPKPVLALLMSVPPEQDSLAKPSGGVFVNAPVTMIDVCLRRRAFQTDCTSIPERA